MFKPNLEKEADSVMVEGHRIHVNTVCFNFFTPSTEGETHVTKYTNL